MSAEEIERLRALCRLWRERAGAYGYDDYTGAYEDGREAARESCADDLQEFIDAVGGQ